jgi:hypothetical protein
MSTVVHVPVDKYHPAIAPVILALAYSSTVHATDSSTELYSQYIFVVVVFLVLLQLLLRVIQSNTCHRGNERNYNETSFERPFGDFRSLKEGNQGVN